MKCINRRFFIARTTDGGNSWNELPADERPAADRGEAFFASSGTNLRYLYNESLIIASGGKNSRVFYNMETIDVPMTNGKETAGANSIAVFENYKNARQIK